MATPDEKRKADVKVVIIGDANVGKTCFIKRYTNGFFPDKPPPSVGACFFLKQWGKYNIAIWDTAGEERFSGLSSFYCRNASAAIVAYDTTSRTSFEVLQERYIPLLESAREDCLLCITGMKGDLVNSSSREVAQEEARELSRRLNASHFQNIRKNDPGRKLADPFFETSSKTGKNVDQVFEYIFSNVLLQGKEETEVKREDSIRPGNKRNNSTNSSRDGGCCS